MKTEFGCGHAGRQLVWNRAERAMVDQGLSYGDAIADKIERQPQLLDIPLANIERWLAKSFGAVSSRTVARDYSGRESERRRHEATAFDPAR